MPLFISLTFSALFKLDAADYEAQRAQKAMHDGEALNKHSHR
jgi:hypothetical protein